MKSLFVFFNIFFLFTLSQETRAKAWVADSLSKNTYNYIGIGGKQSLSGIFDKQLKKTIILRFFGHDLDSKTYEEVENYYKKNIPNKFNKALRSSGNLHNPALKPLNASIEDAIKATGFYRNILNGLNEYGYKIKKMSLEKFEISTRKDKFKFYADIRLYCILNPIKK